MYNNNPYAQPYGQAVQQQQPAAWQQQQQQPGAAPPPPAGTAPPPPPSMPAGLSAEQAAQYSNYGYGSVPQRGGAGRGAGQNNVSFDVCGRSPTFKLASRERCDQRMLIRSLFRGLTIS